MIKFLKEKNIHIIFEIGIIIKAIYAAIEILSSIALLFASPALIGRIILFLTQEEIIDDPHDNIANYLIHFSQHYTSSTQFFAFYYLLTHGLIKAFLAAGLLRNKLWAYPVSIVVLILFIIYQVYRFSSTHSLFLVALTIFDLIVLWLIWHEYKIVKKSHELPLEQSLN